MLKICFFASVMLFSETLGFGEKADHGCWKRAVGRGAGKIPSVCASNEDKVGALCYPKCKSGWYGVSNRCWKSCPRGFTSSGLFCKPPQYHRGRKYDRKNKCEKQRGKGKCAKVGRRWQEKCRSGYWGYGRRCKKNCGSGLKQSAGSCKKTSFKRATRTLKCKSGFNKENGLCYKPCKNNWNGEGPMCWQKCPAGTVRCGGALCLYPD